jgi:hypothetical protein
MLAGLRKNSEKLIHAAKLAAALGVAIVAASHSSSLYAAQAGNGAEARSTLHAAPVQR